MGLSRVPAGGQNFKDISNERYGLLVARHRTENDERGRVMWFCECDCGGTHNVLGAYLRNGEVKSCGCLGENNKMLFGAVASIVNKRYNDYRNMGDYYIGIDCNGVEFYIDSEDYERFKHINWYVDHKGYVTSNRTNTTIKLHRLIMNAQEDDVIDHRDHNPSNNRRYNLRKATVAKNNYNHVNRIDNTSGCSGVTWDKRRGKWHASIGVNNKRKHLGYFNDKNNAIAKRKMAEEECFGEFSYDNSIGGSNNTNGVE